MKSKYIFLLFILFLATCKTTQKDTSSAREVSKEIATTSPEGNAKVEPPPKKEPYFIPSENPPPQLHKFYRIEDWNRVLEGFINSSTYQVKVTSLKPNKEEAMQEAIEVAKRKAAKMLQAEISPNPSPEAKVEVKILVEEFGKLVADSDLLGDRRVYVFQVRRPALEIFVKEKLK